MTILPADQINQSADLPASVIRPLYAGAAKFVFA
jgi:hypothetical protein